MDRLGAIGDPDLRRAMLFVLAAPDPVTADELASALDLSRTVARSRLERLSEAGLLVTGFERRSGRSGPGAGRPAKTYAVAVEAEPIEFPRRYFESLVGLLVDAVPPRRLAAIGSEFGIELARAAHLRRAATTRAALERVCRGLGRLGFHAAVESVGADDAVIVSRTCPLRALVVASPELRDADQGMWRGLVAVAAGDDVAAGARCHTYDCLDRHSPCRIVVKLGARS
jgi:predicted ArsR family transcriptional regulator